MVLTCEMCGSSLDVNKAINDVVTCEYCDSATNIHGFIHLNMSSNERAAALMKRGFVLIEFKVWDKAKVVLSKAVEYDPENAKAYLGLLLVDTERSKEEQLASYKEVLSDYKNYQKALQFADVELKKRLEAYNDETVERKREEEKKQQERERKQQEREAREQRAREKREEVARKHRKKMQKVAMVLLLVLVVITTVVLRSRSLALDNLRTYSDLPSVVEWVSQERSPHDINERGLTPIGRSGIYTVNSSLVRAAGFSEIHIRQQTVVLQGVTRFANIDFNNTNHVRDELLRMYGIEAEVSQSGGEVRSSGQGALMALNISRTPTRVSIAFEKEGVPVVIRMVRNYTWDLTPRTPGVTRTGSLDNWIREVNWTVTIGDR